MTKPLNNRDDRVIADFGREWDEFDQSEMSPEEGRKLFGEYFALFPWDRLPPRPAGFDLGCGSGRWAQWVAPRVAELHCIDPSSLALAVARRKLADFASCRFHLADVSAIPLEDGSMDFGYSLGVLHHVPDTAAGIRSCAGKLKPGAPFLLYLYYAFDNRPPWYAVLWRASNLLRKIISKCPYGVKFIISQVIALTVYYPLARGARWSERRGLDVFNFPLSSYRHCSFYVMKTDALDRFGTRLEQRFTRSEIAAMMRAAGLTRITFGVTKPFWCAIGYKA